jgi:hypothetical protein
MVRIAAWRAAWRAALLLLSCMATASCNPGVPQSGRAAHATRQQLIGAWQLESIHILGSNGPLPDPFYNTGSTGLLIYDPSGWMSVQIVGQPRPAMAAPASRPARAGTADDTQLKAAVLDTYYAYFATWQYDETTSTVTHHVKSSLIPGEAGASYSQRVTLEGQDLIFTTVRQAAAGGTIVQKKVWKRIIPGPFDLRQEGSPERR